MEVLHFCAGYLKLRKERSLFFLNNQGSG